MRDVQVRVEALGARVAAARPIVQQMVAQNGIPLSRCTRIRFKHQPAKASALVTNFDDTPWMGEWDNAETGD